MNDIIGAGRRRWLLVVLVIGLILGLFALVWRDLQPRPNATLEAITNRQADYRLAGAR